MNPPLSQELLLSSSQEHQVWELYHENSKLGRNSSGRSDEELLAWMKQLHQSLPFEGYSAYDLPESLPPLTAPLEEAILTRVSNREMEPSKLMLDNVTQLLRYSYGITRESKGAAPTRAFRVVPSGGALYPLEIFFYSLMIDGLPSGLYHYNPSKNNVRLLRNGDLSDEIGECLVHSELAQKASLMIFITAIFERSIFKYQERGYRFILLEAGHVAQNLNLVATALGLASVNIGGFFDRDIDDFIGIDGVTHSTLYMIAIGQPRTE